MSQINNINPTDWRSSNGSFNTVHEDYQSYNLEITNLEPVLQIMHDECYTMIQNQLSTNSVKQVEKYAIIDCVQLLEDS